MTWLWQVRCVDNTHYYAAMGETQIICGASAVELWRVCTNRRALAKQRVHGNALAAVLSKAQVHCTGVEKLGLKSPVNVMVPNAGRRGGNGVHCTVHSLPLPLGSLCHIDANTYVTTPEFCFLSMASRLPAAPLAMLGFELCGTYAPRKGYPAGQASGLEPLTHVDAIADFILKAGLYRGAKQAARVCNWLADNAASPREAATVALLCAPTKIGGYGLEVPVLNRPVEVPQRLSGYGRGKRYVCDMFWESAMLDLEYDSKHFHQDEVKRASDADRRDALALLGITSATITPGQLHDLAYMDACAKRIAKHLGKRLRTTGPPYRQRREQFLEQLLDYDAALSATRTPQSQQAALRLKPPKPPKAQNPQSTPCHERAFRRTNGSAKRPQ